MSRVRKAAYIYRRPGRKGLYAWLSRTEKHISLETTDEDEAQAKLVELLRFHKEVRGLAAGEKSLVDIFEVTRLRAEKNHTPKTTYELHLNLRRILTWIEPQGVVSGRDVTRDLVERYKSARREGGKAVGASRVNRELDSWRKAMKVAVEFKCALPACLTYFEKLREPRPVPQQRGLTKVALITFLKHVDPAYHSLYRLVVGTGLRDEEIRHLELADIGEQSITVTPKPGWTTKGYHYRTIPASVDTIDAAKKFLSTKGKISLDKKRVWKVIGTACDKAEIARFSLQDLRRAWGSHLLQAGHGLQQISQWYGHKDVITTMRYLRIVADMPAQDSLPW